MATAGGGRGRGAERAFAPSLPEGGSVVLDAEESAHLVRSRRVQAGEAVVLFDGRGTTRAGRLLRADPRAAEVQVLGPAPDRRPPCALGMAVSMPEMGRADRMVAALAELGVARLAPLICARTPAGRAEGAARRAARWTRLAREACKVNGCSVALEPAPPLRLEAALAAGAVLLDPDPAAAPLAALPRAALGAGWLLVGPEGGFAPAELERARETGAAVARLGAPALRVETAAVAAAAIWLAGPDA